MKDPFNKSESLVVTLAAIEVARTASAMSSLMENTPDQRRWFFLNIVLGLIARLGETSKGGLTAEYIRGQQYLVATEIEPFMEDLKEMVTDFSKETHA